jgi:hypothetical protein
VPPGDLAHFVRDTVAEVLDLAAIVDTHEEERTKSSTEGGICCRTLHSRKALAMPHSNNSALSVSTPFHLAAGLPGQAPKQWKGARRRPSLARAANASGRRAEACLVSEIARVSRGLSWLRPTPTGG